ELSTLIDDVHLAQSILTERGHGIDRGRAPGVELGSAIAEVGEGRPVVAERPDLGGAVVREEVGALQIGHGATAVHIAADDRAAVAVRVIPDRGGDVGIGAAAARQSGAAVALQAAPAVVLAAGARRGLE